MMEVKYEDPSHGWLAVPREMLEELGITEKISNCSYERGDFVFLEEDCDMPLFLNAMEAKGEKFDYRIVRSDNESFVCKLDHYQP